MTVHKPSCLVILWAKEQNAPCGMDAKKQEKLGVLRLLSQYPSFSQQAKNPYTHVTAASVLPGVRAPLAAQPGWILWDTGSAFLPKTLQGPRFSHEQSHTP